MVVAESCTSSRTARLRVLRGRAGPLLARAVVLLRRHPVLGVAVGRLVGGVRTTVPVVAVWSGMRHPRFAAGDVPAAGVWALLLVGLGRIAGGAFDEVRLAVGLVVGRPARRVSVRR